MPTVVTTGSPRVGRLVGTGLLLIGAGILALAWHLTRQEPLSEAGNPYASGVVERIDRRVHLTNKLNRSGYQETASSYVTCVRFTDAGGDSHLLEASSPASPPPSYRVGEAVAVEVPRGYPGEAVLVDHPSQPHKPVFVWGLGLMAVGMGLLCLLLPGRARN